MSSETDPILKSSTVLTGNRDLPINFFCFIYIIYLFSETCVNLSFPFRNHLTSRTANETRSHASTLKALKLNQAKLIPTVIIHVFRQNWQDSPIIDNINI